MMPTFPPRRTMRRLLIAAAAAALAAAPAAAQSEADLFAYEMMQRLAENHAGVQDYSFTLVWRSTRLEFYVHHTPEGWQVATPQEGSPVHDLLSAAVLWPEFASVYEDQGEDGEAMAEDLEFRMERDTLGGRPARVLFARRTTAAGDAEALPDSFRLYVDEASGQIARVQLSGIVEEEETEDGAQIQRVDGIIDWEAYEATEGLTLPRRLRVRMRMEVEMSSKERQSMREDLANAAAAVAGDDSPDAVQMRELLELVGAMLMGGEMDLRMQMEEVRVNPGRPAWFRRAGKG